MTKLTSKFLAAGAIAALAIAISAAPSEAGRAKRAAATPKPCTALNYCSTNCAGGWCDLYVCGFDGKWYRSVVPPSCLQGACPNIQKKC